MRYATVLQAIFLLTFPVLGLGKGAAAEPVENGFARIFNGKDLSEWDGDPRFWSVKNGVIRGLTTKDNVPDRSSFLIFEKGLLDNFELRLRFRITRGDSGVQIRGLDRGNWHASGYQAEISPDRNKMGVFSDEGDRGVLAKAGQKVLISADGKRKVVGSVGERKKILAAYKEKDWNEMTIIGTGNRLVQKINGVVFSELIDNEKGKSSLSGILGLELGAGVPTLVEFKDIRVRFIEKPGTALFNGKDLTGWEIVSGDFYEGHGKVYVKDGKLILEEGMPMTGIRWKGDFPKDNYEVYLDAMRISGIDFFCGMTFPVASSWCTLIVGGWGGMVVGLSNIDDKNASENETTLGRQFEDNRWYHIKLRVTPKRIQVWIDGEQIIDVPRAGHKFSVWDEQQPIKPFGISTWVTGAALRNITLRRLK